MLLEKRKRLKAPIGNVPVVKVFKMCLNNAKNVEIVSKISLKISVNSYVTRKVILMKNQNKQISNNSNHKMAVFGSVRIANVQTITNHPKLNFVKNVREGKLVFLKLSILNANK